MAKRTLLKVQDRQELFDIPADEDSLIRHYSLSPADRLVVPRSAQPARAGDGV